MIYEFRNIKNESHSQGYATVIILNNQANIDPINKSQIALAKKLGGQPQVTRKKTPAPKKESK